MAPMDDQRYSSSPEMGFTGYRGYNIQGPPSETPLPLPPLFPAQQPRYLTPTVPIFERGFTSIRRSSQSSVNDAGPFLRPQDRASQHNYAMNYPQFEEEFPEEDSPEPVFVKPGIQPELMENASEFVKKLFKALEDPRFQLVMCWGPLRDRFIIMDVEEFTKIVLPRLYKHSNFASFVRQLNKYDFHKVRGVEDDELGDQHWCFRHSNFHADRPEDLEKVKRKPAIHQRGANTGTSSSRSFSSNSNDSRASPGCTSFISHRNPSPYLHVERSSSSSNEYRSSSVHKVGGRSYSPSRAELYSEIQSLKQETEDSKVKMRDLDRTSEAMRTKMEDIQKLLDKQGGALHLLALKYLPTTEDRRVGK